ncbi:protein PEAK3 [Colius striatus]|uniref:protein PEAK3 n=1 Tax=Colius striatus TaxID=57412 RepID=UPI002B1E7EE6|nr:protein PEAK3 [Colius striatus]
MGQEARCAIQEPERIPSLGAPRGIPGAAALSSWFTHLPRLPPSQQPGSRGREAKPQQRAARGQTSTFPSPHTEQVLKEHPPVSEGTPSRAMATAPGARDGQREQPPCRELEPPRAPPLPGKTQRAIVTRCSSLDAAVPMPDSPEGCPPRPPASALIYSNVGQLRAHLVPRKASRGEGAGRSPSQPDECPLPPPLPKKQLQRAESLPEKGPSQHRHSSPPPRAGSTLCGIPPPRLQQHEGAPSAVPTRDGPSWAPKKPLTKSQSLGEAAGSRRQELTFGTADGELGQALGGAGPRELLPGCCWAALGRLSARIQQRLLGPERRRLRAELAGKGWAALRVLGREPCCHSRDAWYFPVGFTFERRQLVLAAKVPKPCCTSLEVQSSLGAHCSIQSLISHFTEQLPEELVLPGELSPSPSSEQPAQLATRPVLQVFISPEVPYQTLAGFVRGSQSLHRTSPGHYERLACLLLLQVCMGLEHLRLQNVGQGDLCLENLLLVQCPCSPQSQQGKEAALGLSLPRLLISSFFKVESKQRACSTSQEQDWTEGFAASPSLAADELNVGMLIYQILHVDISLEKALGPRSNRAPEIPSLSIYSTGLKRLATLLLQRDPCKRVSIEQARSILQVLLWGPRQELFARSKKTLPLLRSWVELKRALLLLRFAEDSAGAAGSPGLEDWLCCQYFKEVTEHTLCQVTQALYTP